MHLDTEHGSSPWPHGLHGSQGALAPTAGPLDADRTCDICIVGAGIAGLTTALLLTRTGRDVLVLDAGEIGGGETGRTTAHLSNAIDDRFDKLERIRGKNAAWMAAASHGAAIDWIEAIVRDEAIRCDFARVDGWLFLPPGRPVADLDREFDAASRAGLAVERAARAPIADFDTGPAIRFPRQAQVEPLAYLTGLARGVIERGGRIVTRTRVTEVEGGARPRVVTAIGPVVTANAVIVATNVPFHERFALHTKQAAYTTYAIGAKVGRGAVEPALFWDDDDPYHYVRVHPLEHHDLLIVGGEDHRSGQDDVGAAVRHGRLEEWMRERFPFAGFVDFQWSGQVMETLDGLAHIGADAGGAENVYVATGDSGMGMTHGTIAGILLTDLLTGVANPWTALYDPARVPVAAAAEYAAENLKTLRRYADWVTPGSAASTDRLESGAGAIVRRGLRKLAVYRDETGAVHEFSAVCPHLGCIVQWNGGAKTWDCPCHGSRFDALGHFTCGPANRNLSPGAVLQEHHSQKHHSQENHSEER